MGSIPLAILTWKTNSSGILLRQGWKYWGRCLLLDSSGPLASLTPGERNRGHFQCRPHGEFCLPGRCMALHGSTSRGIGPGWCQPPNHRCRHVDRPLRIWLFTTASPPECCFSSALCLTSWSCSPQLAAWPQSQKRWIGTPGRSGRSLVNVYTRKPSPELQGRTAFQGCWRVQLETFMENRSMITTR